MGGTADHRATTARPRTPSDRSCLARRARFDPCSKSAAQIWTPGSRRSYRRVAHPIRTVCRPLAVLRDCCWSDIGKACARRIIVQACPVVRLGDSPSTLARSKASTRPAHPCRPRTLRSSLACQSARANGSASCASMRTSRAQPDKRTMCRFTAPHAAPEARGDGICNSRT